MRTILFGLGLLCLGLNGFSQQTQKSLIAANGSYIGFYEFRPYNYNSNPTKKYPLIIFLQGVGGQGNGTNELYLELAAGLPKYISEGATMTFNVNGVEESFLVLSPQLDRKYGSWQNFYVDEMLAYARQNLRVDNSRIYLTGLSLGGGGVWKYASASKTNAEQFAAIAPICGTCDYNYSSLASSINAGQTAVWAYHAQNDPVVSANCTHTPIDALRAGYPQKEIRKTIYSQGEHGVWDWAYGPSNTSDNDGSPKNLFEWFLKNQRSGYVQPPANKPPVANAGSDITITLPTSTVTLNGTASSDPDGTIASFSWSKVSGPAANINNASWGSTSVSSLINGTYVFRLTVADNSGATAYDDVTVTVNAAPVTAGSGLNYRYYEGDWNALPNFNSLTPVKSGSLSNIDLSPKNRDDYYAFVWEGYINITTPGTYTFETVSDDGSKLYFNSLYSPTATALVNNDGMHAARAAAGTVNIPSAGLYPVTITFFEKGGGETMQAYWTGPNFARQPIPNSAFTSNAQQQAGGLKYRYYEGDWNVLPDFNALAPLKSGSTSNVDMSTRNRSDYYGFLWEGFINIPTAGSYTFETVSDDGSRFYFNSTYAAGATPLVNNDGLHAPRSATGTVNVAAGVYPVAISFFEKGGGETMQVYWSGPGFSRQLIPNSAFSGGETQLVNTPPAPGLKYRYYQGNWNALPDFNSLSLLKSGTVANVDMSPKTSNDYYAFLWEGYINITTSGNYTFETISDDGSKLYFNSMYAAGANALVNNDGLHAPRSASGSVYIAAGVYPIAISFFENGGGETMQLYWSGPGFSRQPVPNAVFTQTENTQGYAASALSKLPDLSANKPGLTDRSLTAEDPAAVNAFPNPFQENFTLAFNQKIAGDVTVGICNQSGKLLFNYIFKNLPANNNRLKIDLSSHPALAPGIYFARLNTNGIPAKMIKLIKK